MFRGTLTSIKRCFPVWTFSETSCIWLFHLDQSLSYNNSHPLETEHPFGKTTMAPHGCDIRKLVNIFSSFSDKKGRATTRQLNLIVDQRLGTTGLESVTLLFQMFPQLDQPNLFISVWEIQCFPSPWWVFLYTQELSKRGLGENIDLRIMQLPAVYQKAKEQVFKIWTTLQPLVSN